MVWSIETALDDALASPSTQTQEDASDNGEEGPAEAPSEPKPAFNLGNAEFNDPI